MGVCHEAAAQPATYFPHPRRAHTTDEGGRGLHLVTELTRRWCARPTPSGGKVVRADLDHSRTPRPSVLPARPAPASPDASLAPALDAA